MLPDLPPVAPTRRPGRPARPDTGVSREQLLDAALFLFAQNGVAATPLAAIARAAGLTTAMVHYHFHHRTALIHTLVAERIIPVIEYIWDVPANAAKPTPRQAIRASVTRIVECATAQPWLPPLWMREIVNEGGELRAQVFTHLPVERLRLLAQMLSQAQAQGKIHAGIDPRLVFISILGLTLLPLATGAIWRRLWGQDTPLQPSAIVDHATILIEHGLFCATHEAPPVSSLQRPGPSS